MELRDSCLPASTVGPSVLSELNHITNVVSVSK